MEEFWNMLYWISYKFNYKSFFIINTPLKLILRLPFLRKFYAKRGIDAMKEAGKFWGILEYGFAIKFAFGFMSLLVVMVLLGILVFWTIFVKIPKIYAFAFLSLSVLLNIYLLEWNSKYKKYFKKYEQLPKKDKWKLAWITLMVFVSALFFLILSFIYSNYRAKLRM